MAGKKGQKKRVWSDDEKRSICEQTTTTGVSVAQVARRYSMNANLIFKWLKDPRFAPQVGDVPKLLEDGAATFLPIEVIPTVIDQNPCAHLRMPRDMIFHGWSMRLFQAWQHSATMSS